MNKAIYKAFNVKDFSSSIILSVPNILKEDGTPYSEAEFDTFYQENTGNFNGGGTAPAVLSVTGDSVDNTDPQNPIINAIPLTGTKEGSPVTGDIEMQEYTKLWWKNGDYLLSLENVDEYLYLQTYNPITGYFSKFIIDGDTNNFRIETNNPNSVGLVSVEDFSERDPNNKLIYAQRSYVDKANSYSTNETLTGGTWIDGKPIYRKVFEGILENQKLRISFENIALETLIDKKAYVFYDDGMASVETCMLSIGSETYYTNGMIGDEGGYQIYLNSSVIPNSNFYMIIEYTKTTD